jgi:DNA-binding transcriptional ArsR family regulator
MGRLDPEARMAIKALAERGTTRSEIARLLGVTEGAVRHHLRRMAAGVADRRSLQPQRAESQAEAIEHWRSQQGEGGVNLAALHAYLLNPERGRTGPVGWFGWPDRRGCRALRRCR